MNKTFPNIDIRSISAATGVALDFDEVNHEAVKSPAYMRLELPLVDGRTLILQTGDTEAEYLVECVIDVEVVSPSSEGSGGVSAPLGVTDTDTEPQVYAAVAAKGGVLDHVLSMAEPQTDPARLLST